MPVLDDLLKRLGQLAVLGLLVGIACWPFNLLDRWGDQLLGLLPAFSGAGWTTPSLLLAFSPLLSVPLLLWLQSGWLARGKGSGIPQTITSIEEPEQAGRLLGWIPTLQRLLLWALATVTLLPLGREGPVVQVGASAALWLRRRCPHWISSLRQGDLLAVAGGAGLAGGFNTPLLGVVFVAEEFLSSFSPQLIWPALVISGVAAAFSSVVGQPEFALGLLRVEPLELLQVLWALPLGALAGALGAGFARLLLAATRRWRSLVQRRPLRFGLLLGAALSAALLLSGGASGCDGELLMSRLIEGSTPSQFLLPGLFGDLFTLLLRLIAPVLALGASIPGGLIDPSFAFGALLGHGLSGLPLGLGAQLGLSLGMVGALAGSTQLPVMAVLFGMRLAGDQQLLPGLLVAAVVGAYVSRLLVDKPVYHALKEIADQAPVA